MPENKPNSEGKSKAFLVKSDSHPFITRAQAQQLQKELDQLAVLLYEVKRQTDRVEAAADAIGDALISELGPDAPAAGENRRKRAPEAGTKANSRSRLSRAFPVLLRPQELERAQG